MGLGDFFIDSTVLGVLVLWLLTVLPAAVITLLKERWAIFFAGFLTLGLVWYLGAIPLADSKSWWAQRFYGAEKIARKENPGRAPVSGRRVAAWVCGVLAALAVLGAFAARPSPVLGVDGRTLEISVDGGIILGTASDSCLQLDRALWRCQVWDSQGSSALDYRVKMHRLGCWTATRIDNYGGEGGSRRKFSDCITLVDYFFG